MQFEMFRSILVVDYVSRLETIDGILMLFEFLWSHFDLRLKWPINDIKVGIVIYEPLTHLPSTNVLET